MKLTGFCRPLVNAALLSLAALTATPCGPYVPHVAPVEYFHLSGHQQSSAGQDFREENLASWQALTSNRIPPSDIEQAVYSASRAEAERNLRSVNLASGNRLYSHLRTHDPELGQFLLLAKRLEEARDAVTSPWFYPARKSDNGNPDLFADIIEECLNHDGERLKTRYGLQGVRALFATGRYSDCVEYFDRTFAAVADSDLMKRMAMRYVAGCMARMDDSATADSLFALSGDILSITPGRRVDLMARLNPGAPSLIEYLRYHTRDTALMLRVDSMAAAIIADRRVTAKGDWHFFRAFVANEFRGDPSTARSHILMAMPRSFSSPDLSDLCRAYRMKLDGLTGHDNRLLADLSWLESKIKHDGIYNQDYPGDDPEPGFYSTEKTDLLKNIIYTAWVPRLWHDGDKATAILLAAHADNLAHADTGYAPLAPGKRPFDEPVTEYYTIEKLRRSTRYVNPCDYRSLSFQLMNSLPSDELAEVVNTMLTDPSPLCRFLRRNVRTDRDFYNELTGTVALREGNYSRAVEYLARVSPGYEATLNVYKGNYLSRDPFSVYPSRRETGTFYDSSTYQLDYQAGVHSNRKASGVKLNFARRMNELNRQMKNAPTADGRGLARLSFAIGRRNSLEECWALTQYWRGTYLGLFVPREWVWRETVTGDPFDFIFDYMRSPLADTVESTYDREVKAALATLETDEARAQAQLILGNRATVIRRYGNTAAAGKVRRSCDNWKDWL